MQRNISLKAQMIWNAAGYLIYMFCQWIITILVANLGSFHDAGVLSIAMSVSATFQTIATFGIRNYQVSDIHNEYSDTCYVHFRWLTCGAAFVSCTVFALFGQSSAEQIFAVILYMIFRLSENFADVLHGIAQKNKRLDVSGKSLALNSIISLTTFLLGYLTTKNILVGLGLLALSSVLSVLIYDIKTVRKLADFKLFEKKTRWRSLAGHTLPLCIYMFLSATFATIPKLILEKTHGEEILGIYSSVFAPALLISAMASYLYSPFVPYFAELYHSKNVKAFLLTFFKLTAAILALAAIVVVAAVFLGDFALSLLFRDKVVGYTYLLLPILIGILINSVFTFLCTIEVVFRDFTWLLISCGIGAVSELLFTKVMITQFDINGASYGFIIGSALPTVILLFRILWILLFKKRQKGA